jgi:hypothetical protein
MQTPIQLLNLNDLRVLKVIKVLGPDWNRFTGYLHYKRYLTKEYNSETTDILDELILAAIKDLFPDSRLWLNKNILFKGEYEDILERVKGGSSIELTIRFIPQIPYDKIHELYGKDLSEYYERFKLNLMLGADSEKIQDIHKFAISYIPFEKIDEFSRLIKTIDWS